MGLLKSLHAIKNRLKIKTANRIEWKSVRI